METAEFEWDDDKAASNLARHGVSFELARAAFFDPFGVELLDERFDYGEERYILVGMAKGRLLYVAYTQRGARIRLMSARGAESFEQRWYHEQNA